MPSPTLDAERIVTTTRRLADRVAERFPDRQLARVAERLNKVAAKTSVRATELRRPHPWLRLGTIVLAAAIPVSIVAALLTFEVTFEVEKLSDLVDFFQATIQSLVFIGFGIAFLMTLELKYKRVKAMDALHELRVLAHLVDIHQLDKDPVYLLARDPATTKSSPERGLSAFELNRYLDYCSEMLALIGKIAAVYSQHLNDAVALGAADQVEGLTTVLSRKIWQKVILLDRALVPG